jgi:uncharacterized protein
MMKNTEFFTILKDKDENEYRLFPKINFLYPNYFSENNSRFFHDLSSHVESLSRIKPGMITKEGILRELANVSTLLLEITDDCNLRCRYCVYSGKFHDRRVHGKKNMTWSTAQSAIDFFFNWMIEHKNLRTLPYVLSLGFYGGEALLNFDLLKKAFDYSKNLFKQKMNELGVKNASIGFGITTNGLLLDKEIVDFLVNNDFNLILSLDGPREIQDRNKGRGNFGILIKIIEDFAENYFEYYKKKVSFSIVYDKETDLQIIRDFFSQALFQNVLSLNFGYVTNLFSDIKHDISGVNEKKVVEEIFNKIEQKSSLFKIEKGILSQQFEFNINQIGIKSVYGGYCTLGSKKIFVRVNGDFMGCEKMSDSFVIGNTNNGFDVQRIMEIGEAWIKETENCGACILQGCCHACVGTNGKDNQLDFNDYCSQKRASFLSNFSDYIKYRKIK